MPGFFSLPPCFRNTSQTRDVISSTCFGIRIDILPDRTYYGRGGFGWERHRGGFSWKGSTTLEGAAQRKDCRYCGKRPVHLQGQNPLRQRLFAVYLLAFHDVTKLLPCQNAFLVDSLYYLRQDVRGCFPRDPKHGIRRHAVSLQHSEV